jgi:hypothetical protein
MKAENNCRSRMGIDERWSETAQRNISRYLFVFLLILSVRNDDSYDGHHHHHNND